MRKLRGLILPAALVAAPLAFAAPAPKPAMPAQPPASQSHANVDSATLHKFASAYEDVMTLRAKYIGQLKSAKSNKQKNAIKKKATTAIKHRIAKHMPVSQYEKVGKAVNKNPALRKRLIAILKADQKKAQAGGGRG